METKNFEPNLYGSQPASTGQNSFADFAYATLPSPDDNGLKISTGYGPNFAYSNGVVPILVSFGDVSARRFLMLPGEVMERMIFSGIYIWAAEQSGVGQVALIKWGAQIFRPSLRAVPGNPLVEYSFSGHFDNLGEVGIYAGDPFLGFDGTRIRAEITVYPILEVSNSSQSFGSYAFGLGNTAAQSLDNYYLGAQERDIGAIIPPGSKVLLEKTSYGYYIYTNNTECRPTAVIEGSGPVFLTHNAPSSLFANTPFRLHVKTYSNTF